jgi:hypothetical protein
MKLYRNLGACVASFCSLYCSLPERTLMIINYNFAHYESVPFLQELYKPYVTQTVFCGPHQAPLVQGLDIHKGYFGYKSLAYAMEKHPGFDGYFYTNDDCIANMWNYDRFDSNKIWSNAPGFFKLTPELKKSSWSWWKSEWGYDALVKACEALPTKYKQRLEKIGKNTVLGLTYSDVVYIPGKYREEALELCNHFARYKVFLEIAMPMICACLDHPDNWETLQGKAFWEYSEKISIMNLYQATSDYIHPVKLSSPTLRGFIGRVFESYARKKVSTV